MKYLPGQDDNESSDKLPLVRDYVKSQLALGKEVYEVPLKVRELKPSSSGDWILCSTDVCTGLVNAKSVLGKSLLDLIESLSGDGFTLVMVPRKSSKLGFAIGVNEDELAYYSKQKETNGIWISNRFAKQPSEPASDVLRKLIQPITPLVSVDNVVDIAATPEEQEINVTNPPSRKVRKPA